MKSGVLLVLLLCVWMLASCGDEDQVSPAPSPTVTPSISPSPSPSPVIKRGCLISENICIYYTGVFTSQTEIDVMCVEEGTETVVSACSTDNNNGYCTWGAGLQNGYLVRVYGQTQAAEESSCLNTFSGTYTAD